MNMAPSTNGCDGGRDGRGRFLPGNRCSRGNPLGGKAAKLRAALYGAVKAADIRQVVQVLVQQAKGGDVRAIAELLNRVLGKPLEADILERIEDLEARIDEVQQ